MKWHIEYLHSSEIISAVVSGVVTLGGVTTLSSELIEFAEQMRGNRFICDFRDVSLKISTREIHDLPHTLRNLGMPVGDKVAIIYSADSPGASSFSFFDTRCYNNSLNVKTFIDYDAACTWLLERTGPPK